MQLGNLHEILTYTGGVQTFTVPAGVSHVTATVAGAQGGHSYGGGGAGAVLGAQTLPVASGETLHIVVGREGGSGIEYQSGAGGGGGLLRLHHNDEGRKYRGPEAG